MTPPDPNNHHIQVARINARQAVVVALISVVGGSLATHFLTNQPFGPVSEDASDEAEQEFFSIRDRLSADIKAIVEVHETLVQVRKAMADDLSLKDDALRQCRARSEQLATERKGDAGPGAWRAYKNEAVESSECQKTLEEVYRAVGLEPKEAPWSIYTYTSGYVVISMCADGDVAITVAVGPDWKESERLGKLIVEGLKQKSTHSAKN